MLHVVLTVVISALYMKNKGISQRLLTFIFFMSCGGEQGIFTN